jgi:hypothetical protein
MNVTSELLSGLAMLTSSVLGDTRVYRVVNMLNIPVYVKSRASGFMEVSSGREISFKASQNQVL